MPSTREADRHFDLVVVGSGSAGASAARRASAGGYSVAIIEKDKVGGDCPNYACVPTKALLRSAKVYSLLRRGGEFGLRPGAVDFDWARVLARKEEVVRRTGAATAEESYRKEGIALLRGMASFEDEHHLRVNGQLLRGDKFMIATGSRPEMPVIDGIAEVRPITSVEAVSLPGLPASMIVIGGGPVGCEFAQLFSTFGVRVTVLQRAKTLLPHEEPELSRIIQESLEGNGAAVFLGVDVERLAREGEGKTVLARVHGQARQFTAEEILIATGREARTAELDLPAAGVETDNGRVKVNDYLQTTRPHIYAGGDVCGPFFYTHFAHYQGNLAGLNLFADELRRADYRIVPRVTFTDPEIASVGLTEEQARQEGRRVLSGRFAIRSVGKALVESDDSGLVKIVADVVSGEVLGGHVAAPAAGEMIHVLVAAMAARATMTDLADAIYAFPTFAQGVRAAAREWVNARRQSQPGGSPEGLAEDRGGTRR
jgi:pyruvate/2-oxoglutarate dehydrogenase complex dihydrolipoamide dehydrogenase (E3) component